jgi:hypothetical protein
VNFNMLLYCPSVLRFNLCRERGAKALEERLEMKKIADAPVLESATAAAASGLPHTSSGSQLA